MLLDRGTEILIRPAQDERGALSTLKNRLHSLDPLLPADVPLRQLNSVLKNNPGWTRARLLAFASVGFAAGAFLIAIFSMYGNWQLMESSVSDDRSAGHPWDHFGAMLMPIFPSVLWGALAGLIGIGLLHPALQAEFFTSGFSITPMLGGALCFLIFVKLAFEALRFRLSRSQ